LDLRLDKQLVLWKKPSGGGIQAVVCPADHEYDFDFVRRTYSETLEIPSGGWVFQSRTFLLGWTIEKICLPHQSRLAARV
jgi:dCTP deaminase